MDMQKILWIDLRFIRGRDSSCHCLSEDWKIDHACDTVQISRKIHRSAPKLLCFEYDYPDISNLSILRETRYLFPSVPIIMLTEQHSEAMAIWALRIGVWDYIVKPFRLDELKASASDILTQKTVTKHKTPHSRGRTNLFDNPLPIEIRFRPCQNKKTDSVQAFVESHYHEKIYEEKVAQLCGMKVNAFSRNFKKEQGMTFRHYLINYRICKAREMLENPNAMITDIAYAVGFNDPSYFTRMFHRIVGVSPSRYHNEHKIQ